MSSTAITPADHPSPPAHRQPIPACIPQAAITPDSVIPRQILKERLFGPDEQLDHCVASVFHLPRPSLPEMSPADAQMYANALSTWVPDHPFLNGADKPSSAVFDAAISVRALRRPQSSAAAVERELARGASANPFLSEFYFEQGPPRSSEVPPEHIGILYASVRARLALGETASLLVEGSEGAEETEDALRADVEISLTGADARPQRTIQFATNQASTIRFAGHIDDVEISAPFATVDVGPSPSAVFVAPVSIQCDTLVLGAETVVVERSPDDEASVVYLEAAAFKGERVRSVPVLRGGATLKVAWPGDKTFPWTSFASSPTPIEDPGLDEALRRFRRFVTAFRSHSKGSLARYRGKIEHARMTKGAGQAVLDLMVEAGILRLNGSMYRMDPDMLGALAGATYGDCVARQFRPETLAFVARAL